MALQDILDKIKKETDEKVRKLEEEHKIKLKKLEEEFESKKKKACDEMEAKVKTNVTKIQEKAETLAKMEAKNKLLEEKRKILDKVFNEAIDSLVNSKEYEGILVSLLSQGSLEEKDAEIIPAKGKKEETQRAVEKAGKNYKISDEAANIKGGFILRSTKIEVDNSFESIINKELRSELELEISKVIF